MFWTWKSRHRTGRPAVPDDVRALIREMLTANPLWGAPRIHGELRKLGVTVSESTVAKYLRRHPRPPSQTWRTFLTNHASQIMAADLFVVPTVTLRLSSFLVILAHDRRRIVHVAVTAHPAGCGEPSTTPARCFDTLVQHRRSARAAKRFLRKLLKAARRSSEHEDSREPILGRPAGHRSRTRDRIAVSDERPADAC